MVSTAMAVFPLAIAENQLALTTSDRNERIDGLQSSLQGHDYGCAIHDGRGRTLDRQALVSGNRALPSSGLPNGSITRPANRLRPRCHDSPGAFDFVARVQILILASRITPISSRPR